jgi:hypothetical protein
MVGATMLTGCSDRSSVPVLAGKGPSTAAGTSPTRPPKTLSARQRAGQAAVAQAVRYERLVDELALHPELPLSRLYNVSTQPNVTDVIAFLGHFRSSGDRQVGRVQVVSMRVEHVRLPDSHSAGTPTASVTACLDVSDVHAFGPNGRSIVPRSRKPYYLVRLQMVDRRYRHRRTWLVQKVSAAEVSSCAA